MYFDRNISENMYGKNNEGSYLSCVTNGELNLKRPKVNAKKRLYKILYLRGGQRYPRQRQRHQWVCRDQGPWIRGLR